MRKLILAVAMALLLVSAVGTATAAAAPPHARAFFALLSGDQEVPPRQTPAHGVAAFHLDNNETELHYILGVANIENVVGAHIHLGAPGENGPIVAFLFGPADPGAGPLHALVVSSSITADDLVGPLAGQSLSDLLAEMEAGNAYVNVHTDDGVAPPNTGPGDFPAGEVRGQLAPVHHQ